MIIYFAHDLSRVVHNLKGLDFVSVKMASAEDTVPSQEVVKVASQELYGVICKQASSHVQTQDPLALKVVLLLKEAATILKHDPMPDAMAMKIAAVVSLDDAYEAKLKTAEGKERNKLAEQQAYGREFLLELVREVI